ncbi:MAG: hypothetical protein KAQ98_09615 [Bacteriovoracaceae bacterium]|nr:hypothetical protein [Bacteriovoracaceae bacterium]
MNLNYLFSILLCFNIGNSFATTLLPNGTGSMSTPALSDPTPGGGTRILLETRCYGTNNRGTTNPLDPKSNVYIGLRIGQKAGSGSTSYILRFPGKLTKKGSNVSSGCFYRKTSFTEADKMERSFIRDHNKFMATTGCRANHMTIKMKSLGIAESDRHYLSVRSVQDFDDTAHDNAAQYYGYNGNMPGGKHIVKYVKGVDRYGNPEEFIHILTTYPGQDGFCGGYHSPLMLFFGDKRPKFVGSSPLLRSSGDKTYWPEKNHVGFFLAQLDPKNPKKGIYRANQLFGDGDYYSNGFSALTELDSNFDDVIDSKDKKFKDLVLWKDINSNGHSDKGELSSLKKNGVFKINLKYNDKYLLDFGRRATASGKGKFFYKKGKKTREGIVLDIFFNEK